MDFKVIEAKWQKFWTDSTNAVVAKEDSDKPKKYILVEFPYPSGNGLHVGHAFSFTGADVYARYKRMQGYNVLFPMGWDAFGLPTENYAIKTKRKPQEITKENTDIFRKQMKRLAYSFDWEREIDTSDPNYYKWTQWIFVQLFKKGLAYKKEMPINWCPRCKIGLANEEVVDGKCERCGAGVERRTISQWVVKITDYADKLINGLKKTDFIDKVKQAQINWIGKSEGAKIRFQILDSRSKIKELEVFTTRPDTLYGATFMVIAPEHKLVDELINLPQPLFDKRGEKKSPLSKGDLEGLNNEEIKNYVKNSRKKSELERTELNKSKTGVFSGLYAINPVNNEEIPIWISDFVLASYGTGAIMSVPGHDQRDRAFAKKYSLPIIKVVEQASPRDILHDDCFEGEGIAINSGKPVEVNGLNGLCTTAAKEKTTKWLRDKKIGDKSASYHLRDWIFSRQHYWGEPIPMIYCQKDGWQPVLEKELPVKLPEIEAYEPTDDGKSPLSKIENFVKCKCPICGGEAQRETDTMPNWAGSDWYYLAYCFAKKLKIEKFKNIKPKKVNEANDIFIDIFSNSYKELKKWCPVDVYIGGDEHNTLHLLYSRFIYQFLNEIGVVPKEIPEPYFKRISHGVILGPDNQRMSKSKGNIIVPETVIDKYGVDVLRLYLMFMGPFESTMVWNENTLMGVKRFLDRLNNFVDNQIKLRSDSSEKSIVIINRTVMDVSRDYEGFSFNTVVAKLMEAINTLDLTGNGDLRKLVQLLAPLAPYMAEELWQKLGGEGSVHQCDWPQFNEKYLKSKEVTLPVAINGKVREQLTIANYELLTKEEILKMAKVLERIKTWIKGKEIIREIYVPGKMVNLVIKK